MKLCRKNSLIRSIYVFWWSVPARISRRRCRVPSRISFQQLASPWEILLSECRTFILVWLVIRRDVFSQQHVRGGRRRLPRTLLSHPPTGSPLTTPAHAEINTLYNSLSRETALCSPHTWPWLECTTWLDLANARGAPCGLVDLWCDGRPPVC